MRFFAGDHIPKLSLHAAEIPLPWSVPAYLSRAHRDRVIGMLGRALLAFDDRMAFVELRWVDRDLLKGRRLHFPWDLFIWWRVDFDSMREPPSEERLREIVEEGKRLHAGPAIYDFGGGLELPFFGWMGPLKVQLLHGLMDQLNDRELVEDHRSVEAMLKTAAGWLESPIDLLDYTEVLLEMQGWGQPVGESHEEAMARVLAGRFGDRERGPADGIVKALTKLRGGEDLSGEDRELLGDGGMLDKETGKHFPVLDAFKNEGIWRRFVMRLSLSRGFEKAIGELLPGWEAGVELPYESAWMPDMPRVMESMRETALEELKPSEGMRAAEPLEPSLKRAMDLSGEGNWEGASRIVFRQLEGKEDGRWTKEDLRAAAGILEEAAGKLREARGESLAPGLFDREATILDAAAELWERAGEAEQAVSLLLLAGYWWNMGDFLDRSQRAIEHAQRLAKGRGNALLEANVHFSLGALAFRKNELGEAQAAYARALPIFEQIGERLGEANVHNLLGNLALRKGELGEAQAAFERALTLYEHIGHRLGEANVHKSLGDLRHTKGELGEAKAAFERALPIYEQTGNRLGEANVHRSLGALALVKGEIGEAQAAFERALHLYGHIGHRLGEANVHLLLGNLALVKGEIGEAQAAFERALLIYEQAGYRLGEATAHMSLGALAALKGEFLEANKAFQRALSLYQVLGDKELEARVLDLLAQVQTLMDSPPTDNPDPSPHTSH